MIYLIKYSVFHLLSCDNKTSVMSHTQITQQQQKEKKISCFSLTRYTHQRRSVKAQTELSYFSRIYGKIRLFEKLNVLKKNDKFSVFLPDNKQQLFVLGM